MFFGPSASVYALPVNKMFPIVPSNRNLVLCFDGTTNKFGADVSIIVLANPV